MSKLNILFYSNNCDASKFLLTAMQKENILRFFHLICTDNNPLVPRQIDRTPTLLIHGNSIPYIGGDAFKWLAKIKEWRIIKQRQHINYMQQQYIKNMNNNLTFNKTDQDLLGFNKAEMDSLSDMFSFFEENINNEIQDALPQSYVNFADSDKIQIFTPPLEDGTYEISKNRQHLYKITKDQQDKMANMIENNRKQEDMYFKNMLDNFKNQYAS